MKKSFLVPAESTELVIELPGFNSVINSGPKVIELNQGWSKTFSIGAGGNPTTVTVLQAGPKRSKSPNKRVVLEFEGVNGAVISRPTLVCQGKYEHR